jgi:hypothetical protein
LRAVATSLHRFSLLALRTCAGVKPWHRMIADLPDLTTIRAGS